MRCVMNYGRQGLSLELPDDWDVQVIRKNPMPLIAEPAKAVDFALSNPVGASSLERAAQGCRRACILICDITRPVPNGLTLPPVIRAMVSAGIKPKDITVLIATGLHRPNEGAELREVVGDDWVLDTVRVENHHARAEADHVLLGETSDGIPVKLDRRFVEADVRLVIGLVEPHFMAGYSGGRKLITPGIAHADTITAFHRASLLAHPNAANCVLEGNPLHEQQMQIVRLVGGCLAVNTVLDEQRRLSMVNYGEIEQSHRVAVEFVHRHAVVPVSRRFKTVVTSAAGYPLDKTFYQTVKGMVGALDLLEPGGNLFVVSECSEGMGSREYVEAQRRLLAGGAQEFMKAAMLKPRADVDEWQTQMQLKAAERGSIHLYATGLSAADHALTGTIRVDDPAIAIREAVARAGDAAVAVVPEGPYVIPVYRP